jgi:hypothetical protein
MGEMFPVGSHIFLSNQNYVKCNSVLAVCSVVCVISLFEHKCIASPFQFITVL